MDFKGDFPSPYLPSPYSKPYFGGEISPELMELMRHLVFRARAHSWLTGQEHRTVWYFCTDIYPGLREVQVSP